ncbi:hypothetical protein COB52_04995 [Candidatus Kaiserbacteria bacterium]|nr:MAG: hypothetical protein COB52_04995 [Candidatus Kaiserbacteria bacterium]
MAKSQTKRIVDMKYKPPGAISASFLKSTANVRMIMGPYGSGKTSVCCWDIMIKAIRQRPSPVDGVRYSRYLIIRDTYEQIKKSALLTWHTWFPKEMGEWHAGPPGEHFIEFDHPAGDGTTVHLHLMFVGLGDHSVESVTKGLEITGAYINEADLLSEEVLNAIRKRCGRYPSKLHGGASWYGVILDMNAPDVENWAWKRFFIKKRKNHMTFRQPGGMIKLEDGSYILNPAAENVENLPDRYYEMEVEEMLDDPEIMDADWLIQRMIMNEPGYARDGKPVFKNFRDSRHVAKNPIQVDPTRKITIGGDGGRTPALIFMQQLANGQWGILKEICMEGAIAEDAGELAMIKIRDWGWHNYEFEAFGDPATDHGNETSHDSWMDLIQRAMNINWTAAPGNNDLTLRLGVINKALKTDIMGEPGFLLSPECPNLRKGFNSGYHYKKHVIGGHATYAEKPAKNESSHPMDALQNGMLGGGGMASYLHRGQQTAETQKYLSQTSVMTDDQIGMT